MNSLTILEVILLSLYIGSITLLCGCVVSWWLLSKTRFSNAVKILIMLVQFLLSLFLTIVIWMCDLGIDLMFYFICIPTLIAEIITIVVMRLFFVILRK